MDDMLATWDDAIKEWAWNYGQQVPDREWLAHDMDVWVTNPHYTGKPGRHPEDDYSDEEPQAAKEAVWDGGWEDIPF